MEDTDGGLHPAVDGQSLDEDEVISHLTEVSTYGYDIYVTVISHPSKAVSTYY